MLSIKCLIMSNIFISGNLPKTVLCTLPKTFTRYSSTTVDATEIQQFSKFVEHWWDKYGPMKPLHSMNKLRVPFIREGLINSGALEPEQNKNPLPLLGINVLDVGCGGENVSFFIFYLRYVWLCYLLVYLVFFF